MANFVVAPHPGDHGGSATATIGAVRTAFTEQLSDVVNTFTSERSFSSGTTRPLSVCSVERWGLRTECPTPEHPFSDCEATWILADAGIRLTHQRPRSRHAQPTPTMVTAVRVEQDSGSWRTDDLLLGLEVPGKGMPRFARAEEFAAAVSSGTISSHNADNALRTMHRTLEELSLCGHDVDIWLARQGIVDSWPPK